MRLGIHVSIGKGFKTALDTALGLGCEGMQIFAANPRGWARKPLPADEAAAFRAYRKDNPLAPLVVHLSYLPNLASEDPVLYEKSILALAEDYKRANSLSAEYFVLHPGRCKAREEGISRVIFAVNEVLDKVRGVTIMLFENQAGAGSEIAAEWKELGCLLSGIHERDRVGICFDTCHAFAAGYDLTGTVGWERTLDEFEQNIGFSALKVFHLNDSQGKLGSHLDRHQHIGAGEIGLEGFRYLVNHPKLHTIPGILETPQDSPEDDLRNLATLRGLVY